MTGHAATRIPLFRSRLSIFRTCRRPLLSAILTSDAEMYLDSQVPAATGGVDPLAGEFAPVKLLDADGVRPITAAEQAQFWREAVS